MFVRFSSWRLGETLWLRAVGAKGWHCWCPGPGCTFLLHPVPVFAGLGKESMLKVALFWPFIYLLT